MGQEVKEEAMHEQECLFDEKACEATHRSIESRFSTVNWVFGIIITIQLAFCSFVGYLSTKVNTVEVNIANHTTQLTNIDRIQQQVLVKLDKNGDKLDEINNKIANFPKKP